MEDVSVLQAIFLRENNLRHLSSKLADPAKKQLIHTDELFLLFIPNQADRAARRTAGSSLISPCRRFHIT